MTMKNLSSWKYCSPETSGFHEVVSPDNSACKTTWAFRLNLEKNETHILTHEALELNGVVISGRAILVFNGNKYFLEERDAFYLPAKETAKISTDSRLIMFFGGAPYHDMGKFFVRKYDLSLPVGDIHQIHGKSPWQREVFMTVAQQDEASRLICGVTEGEPGQWTSWPPHQHTADLEEIYCYFNIPKPQFALHLASRLPGQIEEVFTVSTGDFVIIPEGYHPTCGMPGVRSCYFWIMAAHQLTGRRYDLAVNDPNYG